MGAGGSVEDGQDGAGPNPLRSEAYARETQGVQYDSGVPPEARGAAGQPRRRKPKPGQVDQTAVPQVNTQGPQLLGRGNRQQQQGSSTPAGGGHAAVRRMQQTSDFRATATAGSGASGASGGSGSGPTRPASPSPGDTRGYPPAATQALAQQQQQQQARMEQFQGTYSSQGSDPLSSTAASGMSGVMSPTGGEDKPRKRRAKHEPPMRSKFSLEVRRQLKGYSDEEIRYAEWIGICIEQHPHLLTIARQGISAPVPEPWVAALDQETQEVYYYNQKTGESSAEHPLDSYYREWCAAAAAGREFRISKDEFVSQRLKTVKRAQVGRAPTEVRFNDRATGSEIRLSRATDGSEGISYTVNGDPRPIVRRIVFDSRALQLQFPEIGKGLTVPKDNASELLRDIRRLCDACGVDHDLPAPPTAPPQNPMAASRLVNLGGTMQSLGDTQGSAAGGRRQQGRLETPPRVYSPQDEGLGPDPGDYSGAADAAPGPSPAARGGLWGGGAAGGGAQPQGLLSPTPPPVSDGDDDMRSPGVGSRARDELLEECLEKLKGHGLGLEELLDKDNLTEKELEELLKDELGYGVLERQRIKGQLEHIRVERRAEQKNRELEEQMEGYAQTMQQYASPSSAPTVAASGAGGGLSAGGTPASPAPPSVDPGDPDARNPQEVALEQEENERMVTAIGAEHVPEEFVCTITGDIMCDPVVTGDGHVYERAAIKAWLSVHDTSPNTGAKLANKALIPNLALRRAIATWKAAVREAQLKGALPGRGGGRGRGAGGGAAARRQQRPAGAGTGGAAG